MLTMCKSLCRENSIMFFIVISSLLISSSSTKSLGADVKPTQFRELMKWNTLNFDWPNNETYQNAIDNKTYIAKNCLIAGVNYHDDYYYLTLPRMKSGIPATLTRIPINGSTSPLLTPYPSWEMNALNNCSALQNTQNVEIDSKGFMWILDSGRTSTLSMRHSVNNCPPKLIIYDIKGDKIVRSYVFPENVADRDKTYLYDLVVDENNGDDYVYITDNSMKDPGLIVYSYKEDRSWKLRHSTMFADKEETEFKINGVLISIPINVAGIALGPKLNQNNTSITINEDRELFYCPISSLHLYSISTSILKNESLVKTRNVIDNEIKDVGIKASQTDGMIMDNQGILFYSLLAGNKISMWNSEMPFASAQKIIAHDPIYIQWINAFTFDGSGNLIALGNNLQNYVFDTLDLNVTNFRLIASHTGTKNYIYADDELNYQHHQEDTATESTLTRAETTERTTTTNNRSTSTDEETEESTQSSKEKSSTVEENDEDEEEDEDIEDEAEESSKPSKQTTSLYNRNESPTSAAGTKTEQIGDDDTKKDADANKTAQTTEAITSKSTSTISTITERGFNPDIENDSKEAAIKQDSASLPYASGDDETAMLNSTSANHNHLHDDHMKPIDNNDRSSSDCSKLGFTVIIVSSLISLFI